MTLRLCVLLWPVDGQEAALRRYEDAVLPLLRDHRGRLLARETVVRSSRDEPLEVQLIELEDHAAMDDYLADPRRLEREDERVRVVARTQILRLDPAGIPVH